MNRLSPRQSEILEFILSYSQSNGFPPTRIEISEHFGFKSPNAAEEHLRNLAKKGYIELTPGVARGIRILAMSSPDGAEPLSIEPSRMITLPVIGRVAAGSPILAVEHASNHIHINPELFDQRPDYFLKVRGESMRDVGIYDGDYLAVKQQNDARNGQIIVARIDSEVTVKRLLRTRTHIELLPENPDYEVIVVNQGDQFVIEGIAVGLIRPHSFL